MKTIIAAVLVCGALAIAWYKTIELQDSRAANAQLGQSYQEQSEQMQVLSYELKQKTEALTRSENVVRLQGARIAELQRVLDIWEDGEGYRPPTPAFSRGRRFGQ